jgi:hypothetical protein
MSRPMWWQIRRSVRKEIESKKCDRRSRRYPPWLSIRSYWYLSMGWRYTISLAISQKNSIQNSQLTSQFCHTDSSRQTGRILGIGRGPWPALSVALKWMPFGNEVKEMEGGHCERTTMFLYNPLPPQGSPQWNTVAVKMSGARIMVTSNAVPSRRCGKFQPPRQFGEPHEVTAYFTVYEMLSRRTTSHAGTCATVCKGRGYLKFNSENRGKIRSLP